jgi:hypothetical protein
MRSFNLCSYSFWSFSSEILSFSSMATIVHL